MQLVLNEEEIVKAILFWVEQRDYNAEDVRIDVRDEDGDGVDDATIKAIIDLAEQDTPEKEDA